MGQTIRLIFIAILMGLSQVSMAQLELIPLQNNPSLISFLKANPDYVWNNRLQAAQWGRPDTLELPFFEDFTSTTIYPDSSKWRNNQAFINSDFPINPPSYGVATFDFLNEGGKPYSSLEAVGSRGGDTLTSQAINLADSGGVAYKISDSIFLSFFYQCRGRGDLITDKDTLRLEFLSDNGQWNLIWSKVGDQLIPFREVTIPIRNLTYLHKAFQFRFVNITHLWGNNNHWHLDYILLNKNRSAIQNGYNDYAIQSKPTSLLKEYSSMPYDHFTVDPNAAADTLYINISNQNKGGINAQVIHIEWSEQDTLVRTFFGSNDNNVPGSGFARWKLLKYDFTGLTGVPVVINREYKVRESGIVNPVLFQGNDKILVQQVFERYYAYDDGSAESGFGFNDLKDNDGMVAIQFDLKKADTLRAVSMHLTHNISDVSKKRFIMQVWQDIAFGGGQDRLLYEQEWVTDSLKSVKEINGFYMLPLDTLLVLPKGKFYVGWSQDKNYNLGVGFDKNNGYLPQANSANKNIYFNVGSGWLQNSNEALSGAPMIRPVLGAETPWSVSTTVMKPMHLNVFPNPASSHIRVIGSNLDVVIFDLQGREMPVKWIDTTTVDISQFPGGMYFIRLLSQDNETSAIRFLKVAD